MGRSCAYFSFPPEGQVCKTVCKRKLLKILYISDCNKMTIDVQVHFERTGNYFLLFYIPYSVYFIALTIKYLGND